MNLLSCPVCFGDPSSPMTQSAKWGVLFLLVVVVCVLAAIASVAAVWARREDVTFRDGPLRPVGFEDL